MNRLVVFSTRKEENECIFAVIEALDVELQVVKVMHYGVISQFLTISKGSYKLLLIFLATSLDVTIKLLYAKHGSSHCL